MCSSDTWYLNQSTYYKQQQQHNNRQNQSRASITNLADYFLLKSINGLQHLLWLYHASDDEVQVLRAVELLMVVFHLANQTLGATYYRTMGGR